MSLPGESQGQESLVDAVYGVTQSRTRLKELLAAAAAAMIKNTALRYKSESFKETW